jgi:hypothetical protein
VLEQVLAFLQQHERVTYWALQRQFDLDEAYLEALILGMEARWLWGTALS